LLSLRFEVLGAVGVVVVVVMEHEREEEAAEGAVEFDPMMHL
jgi:hypothetical protein